MTQQNIKRRTLVKGAAWAAPVVAASAAVPAYAASCVQKLVIDRGFWQGVRGSTKEYSTGSLYNEGGFGVIHLSGLAEGVEVKKVTSRLYFLRRTDKTHHTQGTFSPSESYVKLLTGSDVGATTAGTSSLRAGRTYSFYDHDNGGIQNTLTFLGNDIQEIYYPDTEPTNSWAVENVWTAANANKATQPKAQYVKDQSGCRTFNLSVGKFYMRADSVYIGSQRQVCNAMIEYNTNLIELTDGTKDWTLELSVAKGFYNGDKCDNWKA